jgi:hypothetical protein
VREIRSHRDMLGERYYEIRFEDLKNDFEATVRGLFEFAGTPADDRAIERARAETDLSSYSEETRRSGFRSKGSVGGWRDRFTRREGEEFERAAGELLVELGYESDASWVRQLPRRHDKRA